MYCRNCGKEVAEQALMCMTCGVPPKNGKRFCQNCGQETNPGAELCTKCGVRLVSIAAPETAKSRIAAGILGIVLGGLGGHRVYLGYVGVRVRQRDGKLFLCGH